MRYWGSSGGVGGFSIATVSCNYGDQDLDWWGGTNETPLISQNIFRLKDGRFEQIGMSWLKHAFYALSESGCGDCQGNDHGHFLGVGCADTYTAGHNSNNYGPL